MCPTGSFPRLPVMSEETGMRITRGLLMISAVLSFALGLGFTLVPERMLELLPPVGVLPPGVAVFRPHRLLGLSLVVLASILWILPPLHLERPRRLLLNSAIVGLAGVWIFLPTHSYVWDSVVTFCVFMLYIGVALFARTGLGIPQPLPRSESAAQQERNRLARDLHDSLKQQIFSIKLSSAAMEERWEHDPAGARAALADIRRSAQEAMVEMQALLAQLRPEPLATVGLFEALREQCEALGYRCGIQVQFEIGDLPPEDGVPAATQENLFRIAQEALSNIAHHARASSTHVQLGQDEEAGTPALLLRVRDDGQGFDPESRRTGMGLRNMRERLEALGGNLTVESAPGRGTEIRARVPLAPPAAPLDILRSSGARMLLILSLAIPASIPTFLIPLFVILPSIRTFRNDKVSLLGRQHRFMLWALMFWWACAVEQRPCREDPSVPDLLVCGLVWGLFHLSPLFLVLALREAWGFLRNCRPGDAGPSLPLWLFVALLLILLGSLPCLILLPYTWEVARAGLLSYGILYLGWWLRAVP